MASSQVIYRGCVCVYVCGVNRKWRSSCAQSTRQPSWLHFPFFLNSLKRTGEIAKPDIHNCHCVLNKNTEENQQFVRFFGLQKNFDEMQVLELNPKDYVITSLFAFPLHLILQGVFLKDCFVHLYFDFLPTSSPRKSDFFILSQVFLVLLFDCSLFTTVNRSISCKSWWFLAKK